MPGYKILDAEAGTNGADVVSGAGGAGSSTGDTVTLVTKTGASTLTIATDQYAHGFKSYKVGALSGQTCYANVEPTTAEDTFALRFNYRVNPLPASTTTLVSLRNFAATLTLNLNISATGRLGITDALGANALASVDPLAADTWYRVEALFAKGTATTDGLTTMRYGLLDVGPPIEAPLGEEATRHGGFGFNYETVAWGKVNAGSTFTGTIWIDDLMIQWGTANFIGAAVFTETSTPMRPTARRS